jgi:hypothetical protein
VTLAELVGVLALYVGLLNLRVTRWSERLERLEARACPCTEKHP